MEPNYRDESNGPNLRHEPLRIAVLSDTHGNHPLAVKILQRLPPLNTILHLGDNIEDADCIERELCHPVTKIAGNCDIDAVGARELLLTSNGRRLFLTHGDLYGVKSGIDRLYRRVSGENINVVLYGHTHIPSILEVNNILFVNPGSLGQKTRNPSIALLTIRGSSVFPEILPAHVS